jgi:hypothetical protein
LIAIEPDARLADFLRTITSDRALKVLVSTFEDAELEASAFDLGVSATPFRPARKTRFNVLLFKV